MKIEIDLNDILGDEYGAETIQESVKRQVIDKISSRVMQNAEKKIDEEISKLITEEMRIALSEKMPLIIDDVMNAEYTPIDKWGAKKAEPTSFRNELIKNIHENMVYKRETYDSNRNVFTKAVDEVIKQNMDAFKKEYFKLLNDGFAKEALAYAVIEMKKKLGLSV